ncbi:hypothetical protein P872_12350 [Rhodonellum psychrophilum GCM71 = DSM 17998]|uniref:Polyketide cyclase n=2 Tax=Rhodonellum TaxID=336827 RepID=U5BJ79_9BACT|nr:MULTISPECIES: SRPBCC family protein [Rhodonellum]ERM80480.1 hypothetical protein P872_12350 [Rhodonellum psychrophilum GCM71 = DSM 17998]SDZ07205.1 Polyketide cyclase / dehydrase and lipid transport [Rhodonellum ikkaensis]
MKILKIVAVLFGLMIAVVLIVGLFSPKDYHILREVIIERPHQEVYDYVKFLKNHDNFSKWASMDPNMKKEYKGTDGTVGFISSWESENKNVGKGEQEIIAIEEGKRIDYQLRFFEPFESSDKAFMTFESLNAYQTKVQWGFDGHMGFPMNTLLLFMNMEKMIKDDFETGLNNLKSILEN